MLLNEWTNTLIDLRSISSYYVTFIPFRLTIVQLSYIAYIQMCGGFEVTVLTQ